MGPPSHEAGRLPIVLSKERHGLLPWNVIVVALDGSSARLSDLRQRVLGGWSDAAPINVIAVRPEELLEHAIHGIDAVLLIATGPDDLAAALPILASLEDAGIATLTLIHPKLDEPARRAGVLVELIDVDDAVLLAKLEGVLHRQNEVSRLRDELSLAHRFHGGLRGEISRMHEELQLAAMVQREFLPAHLPDLYGISFGALWRPANYVSGDIYDVARLDDDHLGVFIADAVGHGVPAALMTMVICRSLTTKIITGSSYEIVEPGEVLGRLNQDMIRRQGRTTRFATAVYAVVNCRDRTMRLAGAGHPAPVLISAGGATRDLETNGGLLGIFEDETYDQIDVNLAVGDRLLMYSDGFEQAFPTDEADAYERRLPTTRYREEFLRLAEASDADTMIEDLRQSLNDQQGSLHQIDDLTMICMDVGALASAGATSLSNAGGASVESSSR